MKCFAVIAGLVAAVQAIALTNTEFDVKAGANFDVTWAEAAGFANLELRNGASGDLKHLADIASNLPSADGKGSYTWKVPATLDGKGPYAIVIIDKSGVPNYSSQFSIDGVKVSDVSADAVTAQAVTLTTSAPTTPVAQATTSSFVPPTTTSVPALTTSSAVTGSSTLSTATTAKSSHTSAHDEPSTVPNPPDGEGKASGMASPLALVLIPVVAVFFL